MKITQKNTVFSAILLMGMLLCYSAYFQHSNFPETIKSASENNSTSNLLSSNTEIHENDQITNKIDISTTFLVKNQLTVLQVSCQLSQPSNPPWQPPKIS